MISESLEQSVQWFNDAVNVQQRRIQRLESSLSFYRVGFWTLAAMLTIFIAAAFLGS